MVVCFRIRIVILEGLRKCCVEVRYSCSIRNVCFDTSNIICFRTRTCLGKIIFPIFFGVFLRKLYRLPSADSVDY